MTDKEKKIVQMDIIDPKKEEELLQYTQSAMAGMTAGEISEWNRRLFEEHRLCHFPPLSLAQALFGDKNR